MSRTRVPEVEGMPAELSRFLDSVDRRQLSMGQLEDLDGGATLADVIAKVNAMLASQRTR